MPRSDHPRLVSAEKLDRLSAWANRKPRIALMGEFSSGKSTLLNLLIGEELLPTKVTATELPPVWFSYGEPRAYWMGKDGTKHHMDFGTFAGVPMAARYVRVFAPAPMLQRCDIIDTPGISDPNLAEDSWRFAVGAANFMIWCTSSTQAWRETERSTWVSLPERLRANSVMTVTRSDKLGQGDRDKVARRLSRESFGLFGSLVFLATPMAVRGRSILEQTGDEALWTLSGGADLDARIEAGLQAVRAERMDMLERYESTGRSQPEPVFEPVFEPAPTAFGLSDGIRPRRVELPETPRTERPASDEPVAADPLGEMRGAWKALRAAEEPGSRPDPVVVRLPDPADRAEPARRTSLWIEEDEDEPLVALPQAAPLASTQLPPEEPAYEEPVYDEPAHEAPELHRPEPLPALAPEEAASLEAVMSAMSDDAQPEPDEQPLPRAVRIWRDIVARNTEVPSNSPILAMVDQLLFELSRDNKLSDEAGLTSATIMERTRAA